MKNPESGRFWSQRPRLAAGQLEMGFAAVAVALLFTLLAQPASPAPTVTQAPVAAVRVSQPFVENPLAAAPMLPQACIKRVLALSRKQLHFDLVGVMERDCFGVVTPVSRLVAAVPTCLQPAGWHPSYSRRLATGCLMN